MIKLNVTKLLKNVRLQYAFEATTNRIVVFGPSGSGKTLLLKMIAGFFDPDQGSISIEGKSFFDRKKEISLPIYQRNIGYLPQEYTLFPNMTVKDNIQYGMKIRKIPGGPAQYKNLVQRLEIEGVLDQYPSSLSGGQQQRVALARALLVSPQVLLLDEPFSALDSSIRESLRDLVIDIADEMKITTLFVTHDLEEAYVFGKEIVVVTQGEVIEAGLRQDVFDKPLFVETATLMGFVNIWPVKRLPENKVQTEQGQIFSHRFDFPAEAQFLCIRPEKIMFLKEDKPYKASLKENVISGRLVQLHDRGKYMNVVLETENGLALNINVPEHVFLRLKLKKGKTVSISLKEESIVLCAQKLKG